MKLMNEIKSETQGRIVEILVENALGSRIRADHALNCQGIEVTN